MLYALRLLGTSKLTVAKEALRKQEEEQRWMHASRELCESIEKIVVERQRPLSDDCYTNESSSVFNESMRIDTDEYSLDHTEHCDKLQPSGEPVVNAQVADERSRMQ